jgi:YbbR domain-containing protein
MVKIFNNFWLKIVALIMGLFIWLHVVTEKTYNYELKLPVTEIDLGQDLTLAANPPDSLTVKVSAVGKELLRRQWRRQGLKISATNYRTGRHRVILNTDNTSLVTTGGNVVLDEVIYPLQVELVVDALDEATVSVMADIEAEPDEGFALVTPIRVEPAEVLLHGPRLLLPRFPSVLTEKRQLSGLRDDLELRLPLSVPPFFGMRLTPDTVTVILEVVPVRTRVYENVPIMIVNIPPDYTSAADPATVTVELTGPPEDIEQLEKGAITVTSDFRQVNENGLAPLKVDCPSGFKVRRLSAASTKIVLTADADSGD